MRVHVRRPDAVLPAAIDLGSNLQLELARYHGTAGRPSERKVPVLLHQTRHPLRRRHRSPPNGGTLAHEGQMHAEIEAEPRPKPANSSNPGQGTMMLPELIAPRSNAVIAARFTA